MADIDVGSGAISRPGSAGIDKTMIDFYNASNETGVITSMEVCVYNQTAFGVVLGTFSNRTTTYFTGRDSEAIGEVPYTGSKATYTGKNCDIVTGDYAAIYGTSGEIYMSTGTAAKLYFKVGNQFATGEQQFAESDTGRQISLYFTGVTLNVPQILLAM